MFFKPKHKNKSTQYKPNQSLRNQTITNKVIFFVNITKNFLIYFFNFSKVLAKCNLKSQDMEQYQ